jgi:predicted phage terminase large subunit-like protein
LLLYPKQQEFLDSRAQLRGFVGGRGCGKSFIGAYDLLRRAKSSRFYFVGAPTYKVLDDASIRSFLAIANHLGVLARPFNRSKYLATLTNGAEVIFRSAEEPERFRGPNLSGAWLDEASLMSQAAFGNLYPCLRQGDFGAVGEMGWLTGTFTPKGKQHWTYKVFGRNVAIRQRNQEAMLRGELNALEKEDPNTHLVHATTADNPFLPPDFEAMMRRQMTAHTAAQELGGLFLDPPGAMFQRYGLTRFLDAEPAGLVAKLWYWDKAATEDGGAYSCGVKMGRDEAGFTYVLKVVRGQWRPHEREQVIKAEAALSGEETSVWVEQEPGSGGKESAEYTVRGLAGYNVHAEPAKGNKEARAQPLAAQVEANNVYLIRAPWNEDYIEELVSFPTGPYKDQVDASSGAFNKLWSGAVDWSFGTGGEDSASMFEGLPPGVFADGLGIGEDGRGFNDAPPGVYGF